MFGFTVFFLVFLMRLVSRSRFRLNNLWRNQPTDHPATTRSNQAKDQPNCNCDDKPGFLFTVVIFVGVKISHGSNHQIGERMSTSC